MRPPLGWRPTAAMISAFELRVVDSSNLYKRIGQRNDGLGWGGPYGWNGWGGGHRIRLHGSRGTAFGIVALRPMRSPAARPRPLSSQAASLQRGQASWAAAFPFSMALPAGLLVSLVLAEAHQFSMALAASRQHRQVSRAAARQRSVALSAALPVSRTWRRRLSFPWVWAAVADFTAAEPFRSADTVAVGTANSAQR